MKKILFSLLSILSLCSCQSQNAYKCEYGKGSFEYYGDIDSYLNVYRDIWNASTPESEHISKVTGFDSPSVSKYPHIVGGFSFSNIDGLGSMMDSRKLHVRWSYGFTVDFTDPLKSSPLNPSPLNPYFDGKNIQGVLAFVTVEYENFDAKNDVAILMLQKDGRIMETEVTVNLSESIDDAAFSNTGNLFSRLDYGILTLTDNNSSVIGLSYVKPFHVEVNVRYAGSIFFNIDRLEVSFDYCAFSNCIPPLYPKRFDYGTYKSNYSSGVRCPENKRYVTLQSYGKGGTVDIKSGYELVKPYLKTYKYTVVSSESDKTTYPGTEFTRYMLQSEESEEGCYYSYFYSKQFSDDLYFNSTFMPFNSYVSPFEITLFNGQSVEFQMISFGEEWKPSELIRYADAWEFTSLDVSETSDYRPIETQFSEEQKWTS